MQPNSSSKSRCGIFLILLLGVIEIVHRYKILQEISGFSQFLYMCNTFLLDLNNMCVMQEHTETERSRDTIFIGKKPLMTYVTAAIMQLTTSEGPITIKARGMSISTAVSVAQIITRQMDSYKIGDVTIGSESLQSQDGKTRNVSTIEIQVTNAKAK